MILNIDAVRIRMAMKGIRFQYQLAEAVGVSENATTKWMDGSAQPKLEQVGALCLVLDCTPNDLLVHTESTELTPA